MKYQGPGAKVSVPWTRKTQDSEQRAPRHSQKSARMAILHCAREHRLTVVAKRIVEKVTNALTPVHAEQAVVEIYAVRNASEVNHLKLTTAERPRKLV